MPARNNINLVGKTMRVLEVLAECGGSTSLKEITSRVDLVKSSVYRILFSLRELGYVEQKDSAGVYTLTWKMHSLLRKGGTQMTLLDLARPHMVRLRDEIQETVWLAEWRAAAGVVIGGVDVPHRLRFSIDIGSTVGLHSTALGKAIAAHLPVPVLTDVLGSGKLSRATSRTITTREELRAELDRVRQRGFAINKGESVDGLIAVAAPVFDAKDRILASVSVGSPIFRCSAAKQKLIIAAVKRAAGAITADLVNLQFEPREGQSRDAAVAG